MHKDTAPESFSDSEIVSMFFERNEKAISAAEQKYGNYCASIIKNILKDPQDAEECLNDALLKAWESIPPQKPYNLGGYLAKIAKNLSLNRFKGSHAKKRGGGEYPLVLEELSECVIDNINIEKTYERKILTDSINDFLETLPQEKRDVFVLRYWYCLSVGEISSKTGLSRGNVSVMLNRTRHNLAGFLKGRGLL